MSAPALEPHGPPRLRALCPTLDLPWVSLGDFPTPVERLEGLGRELGCELWIKRDDRSGAPYGGNKVRKLELLLARALQDGARTAVTIGAYGSHHALATAIYARELGLASELVLYPQPLTEHVLDDLLLDHAVGAGLTRVAHAVFAPWRSGRVATRCEAPARIPAGGSNALGTVGFVEAGLELAGQVEAGELPRPHAIVVAAGTCGTAAGLALGCELGGLATRVVAVRVVPGLIANGFNLRRLRRGALALLRQAGLAPDLRAPVGLELEARELGRGYGTPTPARRRPCAASPPRGSSWRPPTPGRRPRRSCAPRPSPDSGCCSGTPTPASTSRRSWRGSTRSPCRPASSPCCARGAAARRGGPRMNRFACAAVFLCLAPIARAQSASYTVADGVEPAVREAFAAAWKRLPEAHRGRLVELGLTLRRAPAAEAPADAPLALRLMARATHAWFSTRERAIVVTDAGVGTPTWDGPAPEAKALAAFLHGLEEALEVECPVDADLPGLTPAWRAFVLRAGERLMPGEWPSPDAVAPGDPAFLSRFLDAGVAASLGGQRPSLEALLIHELGHALQLGPNGEAGRIAAWSTLSDWREGTQRKPADGYVAGSWGHEDPLVLIRLLLGAPRGEGATFAPHPQARFPTPYARFDPREDFAECYRLALTDPDLLAERAPEKLLAQNAAGWVADVEAEPLFRERRPDWGGELRLGLERLLARALPAPSTRDARAILQAAVPLLAGLELDPGTPPSFELPLDTAAPVREAWGEGPLGVEVEGRMLYLGEARLGADFEELLERFQDHLAFESGIARMRRELDPDASLAEVLDGRTEDTALAFLGSLLDDESPQRLARWKVRPERGRAAAPDPRRPPGPGPRRPEPGQGLPRPRAPQPLRRGPRRRAPDRPRARGDEAPGDPQHPGPDRAAPAREPARLEPRPRRPRPRAGPVHALEPRARAPRPRRAGARRRRPGRPPRAAGQGRGRARRAPGREEVAERCSTSSPTRCAR
ncbi:MAG: pyridoxal-phosphate dependent enzyme [Planctomycetota bacterium]